MHESFSTAVAGVDIALYDVRSLRPADHGSRDCKRRRSDVEGGLMIFLLRSSSANARHRPVTGQHLVFIALSIRVLSRSKCCCPLDGR